MDTLVSPLRTSKAGAGWGSKALGLKRLAERGFRVPETWVIPWQAYERYLQNDVSVVDQLVAALRSVVKTGQRYAVRSSANVEDGMSSSFAGQFKSVLNVEGIDQVMQAVWAVWASANTPAVQAYDVMKVRQSGPLMMAVIIQEMVTPVVSGVAFSRNPMTGADEIVIEAVRGTGEALMQGGVTPLRWAWKWGSWIASPEEDNSLKPVAQRVVAGIRSIAKKIRDNVDVEWVWDGRELSWVQLRDITTFQNLNVYTNRIAKEVLPGAIKPLIWSVNIPLINSAWIQLLEEAVGKTGLTPEQLARPFYYHTYFNMTALGRVFNLMGFPSEGLEIMTGTVPKEAGRAMFRPGLKTIRILPRLVAFLWDKWNFTPRIQQYLAKAPHDVEKIREQIKQIPDIEDQQLLEYVEHLYLSVRKTATYNIVGPLLMALYNQLLKSQLKRCGIDLARFDLVEGMPDLVELDPSTHLRRMHDQYTHLPEDMQSAVRAGDMNRLGTTAVGRVFLDQFNNMIEKFGHLSDSGNDFSAVPWREKPEVILRLIPDSAARDEPLQRSGINDVNLKGIRRYLFKVIYTRARQYRLFREQISSVFTSQYGMFRPLFLELGRRSVARGVLGQAENIFYLTREEVAAVINGVPGNWDELVAQRRNEVEMSRSVVLPAVIYGDEAPPIHTGDHALTGTPTSRGYYAGPVRVVMGLEDFNKVASGDVLVIPFSEVSWSPLFARAGAVVSESGGILSHSSIIAREYNIPAVVSVEQATRLANGTRVAVDGYRGVVTILKEG